MDKLNHDEKSCGIILQRESDNKILLLQYPHGHWGFIKGHVEENEDEFATARRELEEETAIRDVELNKDFREEIIYTYEKYDGTMSTKLVVFFVGKTTSQDVELSHEHQNHIWLSYDEAYQKVTFDNSRTLLEKAKNILI
jgi:8-oxo-dGTP pyrophosphatase MutT (NUDIX family)